MKLTPFLLFDGDCAAAMAFYRECFGGELTMTKLADSPVRDSLPAELHERIVNARLVSTHVELSATDWLHPTRRRVPGNSVGVYISADTRRSLESVFVKMAQGSDPSLRDDLRDMAFGTYGHIADKFGVHWYFNSLPPVD